MWGCSFSWYYFLSVNDKRNIVRQYMVDMLTFHINFWLFVTYFYLVIQQINLIGSLYVTCFQNFAIRTWISKTGIQCGCFSNYADSTLFLTMFPISNNITNVDFLHVLGQSIYPINRLTLISRSRCFSVGSIEQWIHAYENAINMI